MAARSLRGGQSEKPIMGMARSVCERPPAAGGSGASGSTAAVKGARPAAGTWSQNGHAEDGLEDHDVGERHPDLVLPEEGDDGDGKEDELEGGEGDEKPDISHAGSEVSRASPRRSG